MSWIVDIFTSPWIIPIVVMLVLLVLGTFHKYGKSKKVVKLCMYGLGFWLFCLLGMLLVAPAMGYPPGSPDYAMFVSIWCMIPFGAMAMRTLWRM